MNLNPSKLNATKLLKEIEQLANKHLQTDWLPSLKKASIASKNKASIILKNRHWKFSFNYSKSAFGLCDCNNKTIYVSQPFVIANLDKVEIVKNTLLHEVAHAIQWELSKIGSHNKEWKAIAIAIGCNGERCTSSDVASVRGKYTLSCKKCGFELQRHKKPTTKSACPDCCNRFNNGNYDDKYELIVKIN